MRRWAPAVGAVLVVAGGGAAFATTKGGDDEPAPTTTLAVETAEVVRQDLVVADSYDGTLGFGSTRELATDLEGVVTEAPETGTEIPFGGRLWSIDFEPVILLHGDVPAYRALDTDSRDGPDVQQLEEALVAGGYGNGITVDQEFDSATAARVEDWEEDLGRTDPDGRVELGDIVFASTPRRVSTVDSPVGTRVQSGTTVLTATGTTRLVSIDVDARDAERMEPGTPVDVELPDGTTTTGTIAVVSTEADSESDDPNIFGGPATVPVTVTLDDASVAAAFDTGSVEVSIEQERSEGALVVPVTALLALTEGGYAVEVVDGDGTTHLVGVEVGTQVSNQVGITGEGIEPGVQVVVPS